MVVKADGYGHGAVPVGRAAVHAGAALLAVAQVQEARALRDAGLDGRVLLLSEPAPAEVADAIELGLELTVYTDGGIDAISAAASADEPTRLHLKVDTGMHRVGAQPADIAELAARDPRRPEPRVGSGVDALRGRRRAGQPLHRRAARAVHGGARAARARRHRAGVDARRELGCRHRAPGKPLRHGALRHRRVRDRPRAGAAWHGRPPSRDAVHVDGLVRQARQLPASASPTASITGSPRTRSWPPCPLATPTACRGGSGS